MALVAEWLPVGHVPEKGFVSAMRNNVIDFRGRRDLSVSQTLCAERMLGQVRITCLCPPGVVAAPVSVGALFVLNTLTLQTLSFTLFKVPGAVGLTAHGEGVTARMGAGL